MPDIGAPVGPTTNRPPISAQGRPFTAVLQDDEHQYAGDLAALLSSLAGPNVRVIRVGGPSRSHQTLEHILAPAISGDSAPRLADNARLIARTIADRRGQETRVVLLIWQAERLQPAVLRSLQAMAPYFVQAGEPTLQVAFIGRPEFRRLLDAEDLAPMRDALGIDVVQRAEAPAAFAMAASRGSDPTPSVLGQPFRATPPRNAAPAAIGARPRPERPAVVKTGFRRGRLMVRSLLAVMLLALMGLAAYAGLHRTFYRDAPARAVASAPVQAEPKLVQPPLPTMETPSSVPAEPTADRRLPLSELPPNEPPPNESRRDQVVRPRSGPRIVIHIPAASASAEALSAQLLGILGKRPGTIETRVVPIAPMRPNVRYFYPEDEAVAKQLAASMADTGLDWALRDFSMFQPRPSRGTIEVWLPKVP